MVTQLFGTKDKCMSLRHKIQLLAEDENRVEWKFNGGKDFYNKLAKKELL